MAQGSCLCGNVTFEVGGPLKASAHCHCAYCRKAAGAAFVTWVVVPESQLKFTAGEKDLRWYQSSVPSKRGFCGNCGSTMFFVSTLCPGEVHVTRANLSGDGLPAPKWNCFIEQEVEWIRDYETLIPLSGESDTLSHYKLIPPKQ